MQFKYSDSYVLNKDLPRLLSEESQYMFDEIPVRETKDYSIVRLSSLYNMNKYNNLSIQESLDFISSNIHKPLVILVNEGLLYSNPEYAYLALTEAIRYDIRLEPIRYTFDDILQECIQVDLANNNTKYTDMLLEAIDMSPDPNNHQTMEDKMRNAVDAPSAMAYSVYQKGKDIKNSITNWIGDKIAGAAKSAGQKAFDAVNTPEMQEKVANMAGNVAGKAFDQVTGAAKSSFEPVKKGLVTGAIAGSALTAMMAAVNKLTSSDSMGATGENAANIINSLKTTFTNLSNMQISAPPQQKGLIGRMLEKIKNAIAALGRKIGL